MGRQILDKTMYSGNLKFFSWMSTKTPIITKIAADQTNMTVFPSIIKKKGKLTLSNKLSKKKKTF